jgi:hypothetical protein
MLTFSPFHTLSFGAQGLLSHLKNVQQEGWVNFTVRELAYLFRTTLRDVRYGLRELKRKGALEWAPCKGKTQRRVFLTEYKKEKPAPVKPKKKMPDYSLSNYRALEPYPTSFSQAELDGPQDWYPELDYDPFEAPSPESLQNQAEGSSMKERNRRRTTDLSDYESLTWVQFWDRLKEDPRRRGNEKLNKVLAFQDKYQPRDLHPEIIDAYASRRLHAPVSHLCARINVLPNGEVVVDPEILKSSEEEQVIASPEKEGERHARQARYRPAREVALFLDEPLEPPTEEGLSLFAKAREALGLGTRNSEPKQTGSPDANKSLLRTSEPNTERAGVSREDTGEQRGRKGGVGERPSISNQTGRSGIEATRVGLLLPKAFRDLPGIPGTGSGEPTD